MSRAVIGGTFVQLTSAADGMSHLISFPLYEEGLISGEGEYMASCGKNVLSAAMVAEPGGRCALCRAAMTAGT